MPSRFRIDRAGLRRIEDDVEGLVDEIGDDVLLNMTRLVPTDTLALLHSLTVDREGEGETRVNIVGVDADYTEGDKVPGEYVEFVENGTSVQAAQPFQSPALYQSVRS